VLAALLPLSGLLAGVLPVDSTVAYRWAAATAWQEPVKPARGASEPDSFDAKPYLVNRGIERVKGHITHQGVDLANGHSGGPVRAAAAGLVVIALDGDNGNGYGGHVVLAHRMPDDRVIFTVYAHLAPGSVEVARGDVVGAGDLLGRVGETGHATSPHLHFEVRTCKDPTARWELAKPVDPLAFVATANAMAKEAERASPADPTGAYLSWAIREGFLPADANGADVPTREIWWRALALAAERPRAAGHSPVEGVRDSLVEAGMLPEEAEAQASEEPLPWRELARDAHHLHRVGTHLPRGPLLKLPHERACTRRLGSRAPATYTAAIRKMRGQPSVADLCIVLADLGGPKRKPPSPRSARHATSAKTAAANTNHPKEAPGLDAPRASGAHSARRKAVTGTSTPAHGRSEPGTVRARRPLHRPKITPEPPTETAKR
jgi:hypothetical protein